MIKKYDIDYDMDEIESKNGKWYKVEDIDPILIMCYNIFGKIIPMEFQSQGAFLSKTGKLAQEALEELKKYI
jgi:hypothetical protein